MTYKGIAYKANASKVNAKIYKCENPDCPDSEENV